MVLKSIYFHGYEEQRIQELWKRNFHKKQSVIQNEINSVVSSYTYEEFRDDQQAVQDEILKNLRTMFDSDFIVSVGFSSVTCQ